MSGVSRARTASVLMILAVVSLGMNILAVHEKPQPANADELAYVQTLHYMRSDESYYKAMQHALVNKEGRPPSSIRAIRTPVLFEAIYRLPVSWWRYTSTPIIFAILTSTYLLLSSISVWRAIVATVLVGHWVWIGAEFLPFHAEFWGLAPASIGLLLLYRRRWAWSIGMLTLATLTREIYAVLLIASFIVIPREQWKKTIAPGLVLLVFYVSHYLFARHYLSATGYQPALDGTVTLDDTIIAFTFLFSPFWRLFGIACVLAGSIALVSNSRRSRFIAMLCVYCAVMSFVTIRFGRDYWGLTFAPIVFGAVAILPWPWPLFSDDEQSTQ